MLSRAFIGHNSKPCFDPVVCRFIFSTCFSEASSSNARTKRDFYLRRWYPPAAPRPAWEKALFKGRNNKLVSTWPTLKPGFARRFTSRWPHYSDCTGLSLQTRINPHVASSKPTPQGCTHSSFLHFESKFATRPASAKGFQRLYITARLNAQMQRHEYAMSLHVTCAIWPVLWNFYASPKLSLGLCTQVSAASLVHRSTDPPLTCRLRQANRLTSASLSGNLIVQSSAEALRRFSPTKSEATKALTFLGACGHFCRGFGRCDSTKDEHGRCCPCVCFPASFSSVYSGSFCWSPCIFPVWEAPFLQVYKFPVCYLQPYSLQLGRC